MKCCVSQSVVQWFQAAQRGDLAYIRENKDSLNATDPRESSGSEQIYQGFTALHYAVVLDRPAIFDYLLPLEWATRTSQHTRLQTPLLPDNARIQLAAGQDCFGLAIATGNDEYARKIAASPYLEKLLDQLDFDGNSHLMLTAYFPFSKVIADVLNEGKVLAQLESYREKTFLQLCCRLGRIQHLNRVFEKLNDKTPLFRQFFVITHDSTVFDSIDEQVDMYKCVCTTAEREQCKDFLFANLRDAYRVCKPEGAEFEKFVACAGPDVYAIITELQNEASATGVKITELNVVRDENVYDLTTETERPLETEPNGAPDDQQDAAAEAAAEGPAAGQDDAENASRIGEQAEDAY